jgi:hypothetical protein
MSFPSEYQILAKQSFRCKGVTGYTCPIKIFDRSGYHIVNSYALCPACYSVFQQRPEKGDQIQPSFSRPIQTRQRIIHFLHSKQWTVGNGDYTLAFKDFWSEFYRWSEGQRLYTKKTLVRSVLAELCHTSHDAQQFPISPV